MNNIIFLMGCHYIGDFIWQTNTMAIKKSSNVVALCEHCFTYSIAMFIGFLAVWGRLGFEAMNQNKWLLTCVIMFISHLIIDGITSKITSYFFKKDYRHLSFTTIGFDQWLHLIVVVLTYNFCIN